MSVAWKQRRINADENQARSYKEFFDVLSLLNIP